MTTEQTEKASENLSKKAARVIAACERMLEVCAKATPGPWKTYEEAAIDYRPCEVLGADNGSRVALMAGGGPSRAICKPEERANAAFIAQARTMCPAALRSTVIGLRGQLRFLTWDNAIVRKDATEILTAMLDVWPDENL